MNRGEGEYLVEFIQVGSYMKVSAVDPVSGREVSIVGPASASRNQLTRVAVNKLKYVLAKEKS
ncbi:MAG TPA: hypothetical protein ENI91_02570 [Sphingomonadales bacterium]|nr:hypothetical protein [Sphingomonadales bacterium]